MAAAVADFRPRQVAAEQDQERARGLPASSWRRTRTSWRACGRRRRGAVLVGFAAETERPRRATPAPSSQRKGADFLVANDVSRRDIAFGSDDNEVTVYRREGEPVFLSRRPKAELAASLFDLFAATLSQS